MNGSDSIGRLGAAFAGALAWVLTCAGLLCAGLLRAGAPAQAQQKPARVTPAVVWNPEAAAVTSIREACAKGGAGRFTACFIEGMGPHGASPEAVAFARLLARRTHGELGYAINFTEGGRVAVVHAAFPQRKTAPEVWLLVNGSPGLIDVDDRSLWPLPKVQADLIFQEIRRTFPKAEVRQGDRAEASPPLVPKPNGGQEFLVNYSLLNGCATCKLAGHAQFAFDFEGGRFSGARLVGVWMTPDQGQLAPVAAGSNFTIHLVADHAAGYSWKIVSIVNGQLLKHTGTDYRAPAGQAAKDGVEDWHFQSLAPGRSIIRFQKAQSGAKGKAPPKNFYFVVTGE
ncbi:MAG TPA: protease inhibitor I42 family protein [Terriglobia bacterium]|nr:protease inhibitor I42 family protein [Terriglobia bacterium]